MSVERAFIDTNIFVYLYSDSEPEKKRQAKLSINEFDRFVSTQVLNEFCNVGIRNLKLSLPAVRTAIDEICDACDLILIDDGTIAKALDIHQRYRFSYYDSPMIASALECGCRHLISEDMTDGQIIEGTLTMRNIFSKPR
jgi:predicted nucleic acid-binding protein